MSVASWPSQRDDYRLLRIYGEGEECPEDDEDEDEEESGEEDEE